MPGGRPPTPTSVHKLRGTYRADRHGSRLSSAGSGRPIRPSHLTADARKHWQAVVPALVAAGVVEKLDTPALTALCELWQVRRVAYVLWLSDPRNKNLRIGFIESDRAWSTAAQQFGLTPASRTKLRIDTTANRTQDEFEEYLNKQKFFRTPAG